MHEVEEERAGCVGNSRTCSDGDDVTHLELLHRHHLARGELRGGGELGPVDIDGIADE
jgi:hypothetical protein